MKRTTITLALTGSLLGGGLFLGGATALFAGDPPAPAEPTHTEIQQRVEDLGSADFRIREAAWKALVGFGEKARSALEAALKSDNPSVRFRSEQLIARLNGGTQEKPLDDGASPGKDGWTRVDPSGRSSDPTSDVERILRETQERMKKLEEEMRKEFGESGPTFGPDWLGPQGGLFGGALVPSGKGQRLRLFGRGTDEVRVRVDGGDLRESPRGARIQLTDRAANGSSMSTVYESKSLDALFEAYPDLKSRPVVAALLEKKAAEDAARAKREKDEKDSNGGANGAPSGPGFHASNKSVVVESQNGHTTVTITETGPDGKELTKTYEGSDLDAIRREHPEIGDSIGGMRIEIGPGGLFGGNRPPMPTPEPLPEDEFGGGKLAPTTGPFGLGLRAVDDALRQHLNLEPNQGAVVAAVRAGSRAATLGLEERDVILSVNGTRVAGPSSVSELVRAAGEGSLVVDVNRAGKTLTLKR